MNTEDNDESKIILLKKINFMYEEVIELFKQGNLVVYNPNIFFYLNRSKFMEWIVSTNS